MPSLTVIIATVGRPTLARTLQSLQGQAPEEVLLAVDGPSAAAVRIWEASGVKGRVLTLADGPHNDWGHTARNRALAQVRTTHALYMDDDDSYEPWAMECVRAAITRHPNRPVLFRMRYPNGRLLWDKPVLECGNVSTQILVHPMLRYGAWGERYEGDFDFIASTCALYPEGPLWDEAVIARNRY